MKSSDFDSNIAWFEKALDKMIAQYGYTLTDDNNANLRGVMKAFNGTKPSFGTMIHALDYIDRALTIYEDRLKLYKKEEITLQKKRLTVHVIEIVLASLIIGSKVSEELTTWNQDFFRRLPYGHPLNDLHKIAEIERDLLLLLEYQVNFSTDKTIIAF